MKQFLRSAIGLGGKHVGPVIRRVDDSVTVFVMHDITDEPARFTKESDIWLSKRLFKTQMEFVRENFNVISMPSLLKGDVPSRAALITFDDGYAGIFKNALPILQEIGLPSTIFMNMSPVLGGEFWAERVAYLCNEDPGFQQFLREQLGSPVSHPILHCTEELVDLYHQETGIDYLSSLPGYVAEYVSETDLEKSGDDPLVTLGNHSYVHYNVKNLTDETLTEQYEKNAYALSKFKQYLPVFAFPFGHRGLCFSPDQASYLLKMGAARLFTACPQPNPDPTARLLDRISLHMHHDTDNRLWFQVLKYPIYQTMGKSPQTFGDNID